MRNVWPPSSRNHRTRAPHQTTPPSRIPPKYSNTWILAPRMASNQYHASRRQFQSEIHQQDQRGPPHQRAQPGLRNRHGLGRNTISWTHIGLGLQIEEGTPLHAGIHQESLHQIWPHNARQTTTTTTPRTLPTYSATIQYAKHIDQSPPAMKEQQKYIQQVIGVLLYYGWAVDSTRLVALSSPSGPNRIHYGTHQMAPRLRCNQPRRHPHIRK